MIIIGTQIIIMLAALAVIVLLGVMMNISIKRHDARVAAAKRKTKGRSKYMPEYKKPGK